MSWEGSEVKGAWNGNGCLIHQPGPAVLIDRERRSKLWPCQVNCARFTVPSSPPFHHPEFSQLALETGSDGVPTALPRDLSRYSNCSGPSSGMVSIFSPAFEAHYFLAWPQAGRNSLSCFLQSVIALPMCLSDSPS